MKTTIAIVDDHELMARALSGLVQKYDAYEVLYEVANGEELIKHIKLGMIPQIGFPWKLLFQKIFSKNPLQVEWIFYLKTVEL